MVFDTLYGQDGSFRASPQMLEGHVVEDDDKLWTLTLRPGLLWHNPGVRRALLWAFDQAAFMHAIVGDDPAMYRTPHGFFCPDTPMASDAGLEPLRGPRDLEKAKRMLREAGYAGEKTAMLVATDYAQIKAIGEVAADAMGKMGMNVDYVATDWGTMLQRRNNKGSVDQGGWNCLSTGWEGVDHMDPSNHYAIRGNGNDSSAWPGWCVSLRLEELRNAWFEAPDIAAQQRICRDMQVRCSAWWTCPPSRSGNSSSRPRTEQT